MGGGQPRIALVTALVTACCLSSSAQADRTDEILSRAREAVGGQAALLGVTALSIKGTARSSLDGVNRPFVSPSTVGAASFANLEISCQLPDKLLVEREWPTAFTRQISGFNGKELLEQTLEPNRIWSDTPLGQARRDGRALAMRTRELVRYLLAWLLTVPAPYQVRFADAGEVGGGEGRVNVLLATGADNFSARLFFDSQTHRLVMISSPEPPPVVRPPGSPAQDAASGLLFKSLTLPEDKIDVDSDIRMLLSDFKRDDGILFPHKVSFRLASLIEEWDISRFKVNPPFEADQFTLRSNK